LPPDKVDYDLGEYQPFQPSFLERNPQFPFQNLRTADEDNELPSRLDMRLNKLLDNELRLPTFGLHSPDIFDLQPQLGFGLADFNTARFPPAEESAVAAEEPTGSNPEEGRLAAAVPATRGPFPQLTMKQRQFAVSPELPEFFEEHPDFLGRAIIRINIAE
jgi:hypothetical protein